jgi:8-oxo-dGTP pyrophosphatase MutT (NUDIX family)
MKRLVRTLMGFHATCRKWLRRSRIYRGAGILFCARSGPVQRVLLVERRGSGVWSIPGGGMSPADDGDFWKTALRESLEEVGLPFDPSALRESVLASVDYPVGVFRWTTFVIELEDRAWETAFPDRTARDFDLEFSDAQWFALDELPPKAHWLVRPLVWWLRARSSTGKPPR